MGHSRIRWPVWSARRNDQASPPGRMGAVQAFESLCRAARALDTAPQDAPRHLRTLLQEVFAPLSIETEPDGPTASSVGAGGLELRVPLPALPGIGCFADVACAFVLRNAQAGERLFTAEDATLADRVFDQLRHTVGYDRAVEQGRSEERVRLAQDLHDDIGARLLTLMYQAPDAATEEYVRHTLQDLKTLTRGLAAPDQLLSHASAEWKADISQRLAATQCDLTWTFQCDRDVRVGAVQWSALTRILRELVNNVIAHSEARNVDIDARFELGELRLAVRDDGEGREPSAWPHGLGLGGVRKRVKMLGGQVTWREQQPRGIVCELRVPRFGEPPA